MARDLVHNAVRECLENDGWTTTHDPYSLYLERRTLSIDLGAERVIAATKGNEKIAVEVKSFIKESFIYDFHEILGQYLIYEEFLNEQETDRELYLAVEDTIFATKFSNDNDILRICKKFKIKILIYNNSLKTVVEWKK